MAYCHKREFFFPIVSGCVILCSMINLTQGQSIEEQYLTPHNDARAELNADIPPLTWDTTLESYATDYANTRAAAGDDCALIHSGGEYGENLAGSLSPEVAVALWVDEKQYYDYPSDTCLDGEQCRHYTQVVWKNTLYLGCGSATCPSGATIIVCSYYPPGNFQGEWPY